MLQVMRVALVWAVIVVARHGWSLGSEAPVAAATLSAQELKAPDTSVARFTVTGMTCGSCATTARVALQRLAGVYRATISYDSASALVLYDPRRVTPTLIAQHLERMTGYRATLTADSSAIRRSGS